MITVNNQLMKLRLSEPVGQNQSVRFRLDLCSSCLCSSVRAHPAAVTSQVKLFPSLPSAHVVCVCVCVCGECVCVGCVWGLLVDQWCVCRDCKTCMFFSQPQKVELSAELLQTTKMVKPA